MLFRSCILIVCTLAVMAYEHTAGMKGAAGGVSNSSGNTKNTDEADDMLTVVTSFYPMYIAALNIVDGAEHAMSFLLNKEQYILALNQFFKFS